MPRTFVVILVLGLLAPSPLGATLHRYPLADPEGEHLARRGDGRFFIIHVDHDPAPSAAANLQCVTFDGTRNFPNCCDGHPMAPNYVALEHADLRLTFYYHLKQGSVLVTPGELVACGQPLGLVGSSGWSLTPHLHFQVEDAAGDWIDPYAGPLSQPLSLWVAQEGPYGIPGAWCEGEEPVLPESEPEAIEVEALPEAIEVPSEVVEVPSEVVEVPSAVVEAPIEVAEAPAEAAEPFEPDSLGSLGCRAAPGASPEAWGPLVVGLLGLSFVRGRGRAGCSRAR